MDSFSDMLSFGHYACLLAVVQGAVDAFERC